MSIAILIAAVAIIGGVIVVAAGRGGELARDRPELGANQDFGTPGDVARYRPPPALLGYHPVATQQALARLSRVIAERDEEIAWLRDRLAELQPETKPGRAAGSSDPEPVEQEQAALGARPGTADPARPAAGGN